MSNTNCIAMNLIILSVFAFSESQAAVIRVHPQGSGQGGENWATAFPHLQDALALAGTGDEIWVAAGTYYPDRDQQYPTGTGSRCAAFALKDQVSLYGGFNGTEELRQERDPDAHITILSGDIDSDGVLDAVDVVFGDSTVSDLTVLDGFIIEGGYSTDALEDCGIEDFEKHGGGIHLDNANPLLKQLTIRDNFSRDSGGGIFQSGRTLTVVDSLFSNNESDVDFLESAGGGLYFQSDFPVATLTLVNCAFHDNAAREFGGAVYFGLPREDLPPQTGTSFRWTILNCLFADNAAITGGGVAGEGGGAFLGAGDSGNIVNCTFANNVGSAIQGADEDIGLTAANCIFWGNDPLQIAVAEQSVIQYSIVQGGWAGPGQQICDCNPKFVSGYRLGPSSPARNAGDNTTIEHDDYRDSFDLDDDGDDAEATPDLDLRERIQECLVDLGAFEFGPGCPEDVTGDGAIDIHDLLAILDEFGPCPAPPAPCPGDVDGDGNVGSSDLDAVLASWGPCGCPDPSGAPQSVEDCFAMYGDDIEKLAGCLEALLLSGSP